MVRSKPKRVKPEETIEQFVERVNQKSGKRNGLKKRFVWLKRRH